MFKVKNTVQSLEEKPTTLNEKIMLQIGTI